jgi:hypothetical protein
MKYYWFHRDSTNFKDILSDVAIKPIIKHKFSFDKHLILGFLDIDEKIMSYMTIKYGEDIIEPSHIVPDRTPIPDHDYIPTKKPKPILN